MRFQMKFRINSHQNEKITGQVEADAGQTIEGQSIFAHFGSGKE